MKLIVDVQKSSISGLESEKNHQVLELQETKELLAIFEAMQQQKYINLYLSFSFI